ncbi:hypothetical protein P43SY_004212 [Pythium insidiosum]|uniref:VASt domain-containing protein n=1 Tax=Pythium insidiosum TaxID=114742 RepID=A0AAD5Q6I7_PYTIN|nr:hypothetical protein P43SY_004212 [Pythium insidiosum]
MTAAEIPTHWPSLATSAVFVVLLRHTTALGDMPLVTLVFFTMLPTLVAIMCLQDRRFFRTFKRIYQYVLRIDDPEETHGRRASKESMELLALARVELTKALVDRWNAPGARSASAPAVTSASSAASATPSVLSRQSTTLSRVSSASPTLASARSEVNVLSPNGTNTTGKSLYDQVKENLRDHVFQNHSDAPIYFMDPTTGRFLRVNSHHKLVFTSSPDASCLFHAVKGKTHHWGFHSTIHQRFVGQNIMGKIVVSSKKMNSWEAFRVLERPESTSATAPACDEASASRTKTIYLVLCSARFGKGMWLARNRRTPSNPSDVYLSKHFENAVALVYASDLSAFEFLTQHAAPAPRPTVEPAPAAPAAPSEPAPVESPIVTAAPEPTEAQPESLPLTEEDRKMSGISTTSSGTSSVASTEPFGADFQAPVLTTAERPHVVFPWIEDPSSDQFLELPEKQMTEVLSTTISRVTVREFIEFFIDQDARRRCHEKMSQAPTSSASPAAAQEKLMSEWHLHPQFGFVRKLSYRPPTPESAAKHEADESAADANAPPPPVPIAIDQYHSCSLNEKTLQKATLRCKMYTLSIPYSNCFSIEVLLEIQNTNDRDAALYSLAPAHPVLHFRSRAGVHFSRTTTFAPQITRGVLAGVRKTCDRLLRLVEAHRVQRQSSAADVLSLLSPSAAISLPAGHLRDAYTPYAMAVEVIKGMIDELRAAKSSPTAATGSQSSNGQVSYMPWRCESDELTQALVGEELAQGMASPPSTVKGFFESPWKAFHVVLEQALPSKITPRLFFDALLSDECSFFHVVSRQSGNMDVDIGAWRACRISSQSDSRVHVRRQVFAMPVSGVPGIDVARVEDYHYHVLRESDGVERLEFGMKTFARDWPDGDRFSIEVLVLVEPESFSDATERATREEDEETKADIVDISSIESEHEKEKEDDEEFEVSPRFVMKVLYAVAAQPAPVATASASAEASASTQAEAVSPLIARGVEIGLQDVWRRVVQVMRDASQSLTPSSRRLSMQLELFDLHEWGPEHVRYRLQRDGKLPTHDELTSKVIEAMAALY